jgi:hypothetical protein
MYRNLCTALSREKTGPTTQRTLGGDRRQDREQHGERKETRAANETEKFSTLVP